MAVLFIQELQRNGIIAGLICDLDRDLRALHYRTGERNVQSRSHYRVLLVKDKLHGVSSASLSAIAYSPFSGKTYRRLLAIDLGGLYLQISRIESNLI